MKNVRIVNLFHHIYSFYSVYYEHMWLIYTWWIKYQVKYQYIYSVTCSSSEPLATNLGV